MSQRYKNILVAVDLSDEADDVIAAARYQAEINDGATLHLLNVVKPVSHTHGGLDLGAVASMADLDSALLDRAQQTVADLAARYSIPHKHVKVGNPASEIRSLAEALEADLIVMGTHGRHGLGRLLGSTANAVLHGVPCDVLTVRIR